MQSIETFSYFLSIVFTFNGYQPIVPSLAMRLQML
jgi:hypothetical protein